MRLFDPEKGDTWMEVSAMEALLLSIFGVFAMVAMLMLLLMWLMYVLRRDVDPLSLSPSSFLLVVA